MSLYRRKNASPASSRSRASSSSDRDSVYSVASEKPRRQPVYIVLTYNNELAPRATRKGPVMSNFRYRGSALPPLRYTSSSSSAAAPVIAVYDRHCIAATAARHCIAVAAVAIHIVALGSSFRFSIRHSQTSGARLTSLYEWISGTNR